MNVRHIAAACLWVLGTAGGAEAQGSQPSGAAFQELDITVTVSRHEGPALVLRKASEEPSDVVLVNPYLTDAQQLSNAVRSLLLLQASDPEGTRRHDRTAMSPVFTENSPPYPWAEAMLQRLRRSADAGRTGTSPAGRETIRLPVPRLVRRP